MSGRSNGGAPPVERAKFWLDRQLNDLELLDATYVTHYFSRHVHEGFAIGVIEEGAEQFYYRGAEHVAPAGSIVVINPGEIHTGRAVRETGWTYRMLYPDASLLRRVAAEATGRPAGTPFFGDPVIQDSWLFNLMRQTHISMERSPSNLERESRLLWTLARLVSRHSEKRPPGHHLGREPRAVRQAREYLEEHYAENVFLERLSRVVGLSRFYLLRVFREEAGLPPHAYLLGVRLRKAKTLLLEDVPVARIAQENGLLRPESFYPALQAPGRRAARTVPLRSRPHTRAITYKKDYLEGRKVRESPLCVARQVSG